MKNRKALWIATTGMFIAILVGAQAATAAFGQLVTGSLVNFLLIVSVMTCGYASGLAVALISPVLAALFGISQLWAIIPFIISGNVVLISIWHIVSKMRFANPHIVRIATLIIAAAGKFATLYFGIVKLAIPLFLNLSEKQAPIVSNMFSIPQLFTALIGGTLAVCVLPIVQKIKPRTIF